MPICKLHIKLKTIIYFSYDELGDSCACPKMQNNNLGWDNLIRSQCTNHKATMWPMTRETKFLTNLKGMYKHSTFRAQPCSLRMLASHSLSWNILLPVHSGIYSACKNHHLRAQMGRHALPCCHWCHGKMILCRKKKNPPLYKQIIISELIYIQSCH